MKVLKFIIKLMINTISLFISAIALAMVFEEGFTNGSYDAQSIIDRITSRYEYKPTKSEMYIRELEQEGEAIDPTMYENARQR